jgi:hypothetical protein
MLEAASRGALDFAAADPRDPRWWARLHLVLRQIERDDLAAIYRLRHERIAGLLAADLDDQSFKKQKAASLDLLAEVTRLLRPWENHAGDTLQDALATMSKQWIAAWGNPEDPAVQARIDATEAYLKSLDRSQPGG